MDGQAADRIAVGTTVGGTQPGSAFRSPHWYSLKKGVGVICARVEMLHSSAISAAVNGRSRATNS
jgi:hypothetical protein